MKFFKLLTLSGLILSSSLFATPVPLSMKYNFDLNSMKGKTYLEVMQEGKGIKAHFDADFMESYTFADWAKVKYALKHFDLKVSRKVLNAFNNDERELEEFTALMSGKRFKPEELVNLIRKNYKGSGNIYGLAHFFAMCSGAGVLVKINKDNYFYNYEYRSGALPDDVKSGRSYGASHLHNANDASDVMFLNELEKFLTDENDEKDFYRTLLEVLVETNIKGYSNTTLSSLGQTVATDFLTIYTAELNRHIMVKLNPSVHPLENDLAEATFLSIFSAKTGKLMVNGKLTSAPLRGFWAMSSTGSGRSGIGIGRRDRRLLQSYVGQFMERKHPELVRSLEAIIGSRNDKDLFRGLMEFLNNNKNQQKVKSNSSKIISLFTELLIKVELEAKNIENSL